MKPTIEEFLYFVMWTCDRMPDPTFRNLSGPFEDWCARTGANRHLARLEQRRLIDSKLKGMLRLTDAGRQAVFGRRDPREHWDTKWDGQWRIIMFDLRLDQNTERQRLRRYLHSRGFGFLQKSVWVTPHSLLDEAKLLTDTKVKAKSMFFLDARPAAGESDEEIVSATWDFERINERWQAYLELLAAAPPASLSSDSEAQTFYEWTSTERRAWLHAISIDPLLPKQLWPDAYLGETAWQERESAMSTAIKQANG